MAYPAFLYFGEPYFGLEVQSSYQLLYWYSKFFFWLWRCGFHIVQAIKFLWDVQSGDLFTTLDILVFPNFATTTIFHVHRMKKNNSYLWTFPPRTSYEWSIHDEYMVVLQILGNSCWYRDNFITKLWTHCSYFIYLYIVFHQHWFHSEQHYFPVLLTFQTDWIYTNAQSSVVIQNFCSIDYPCILSYFIWLTIKYWN